MHAGNSVMGGELTVTPAPTTPVIAYPEFAKVEILVGTVMAAEKVEGADKLLKLSVDLGEPTLRIIVAGLALEFVCADLIGKQLAVVANLEPRTLKGVESRGMVLAAKGIDGSLSLTVPSKPVPNGSRLG